MKKFICMLVAVILVLGLCACEMPDTKAVFVGTWTCEADPDNKIEASELVLKDDFTGTLKVGAAEYKMTWKLNAENPDAIDFITVNEFTTVEEDFPVLKGSLTLESGTMLMNVYDGNAKDDDFVITLLLEKIG